MSRQLRTSAAVVVLSLGVIALTWWWRAAEPEGAAPPAPPSTVDRSSAEPSARTPPALTPPLLALHSRALASADLEDQGHLDAGAVPSDGLRDGGLRAQLDRAAQQLLVGQWLRRNAEAAEKNVDLYCEESKKLKAADPVSESPRTKDAAAYLGVRVDWENGRRGLLHLPEAVNARLKALPTGAWVRELNERDWTGLDFSWMRDVLAFDFWSLSGDGPLRDTDDLEFFTAPIPNYVVMLSWVKLRLAQALHSQDLPEASMEVRHLADLIASSGTLVGEMIRLAMLRLDRLAWETSGLPIPAQVTMTPDAQALGRRVGLSSHYFLYPGVPQAVREKALACSPFRCAALMEGIGAQVAFLDFSSSGQEDLAWLLAQKPCDPALARKLARGKATSLENFQLTLEGPVGAERIVPPTDGGR